MSPLDHCLKWANSNQHSTINLSQDCPEAYRYLQQKDVLQSTEVDFTQPLISSQLEFLQRNLTPPLLNRWHPDYQKLQPLLDDILIKTNRDDGWIVWEAFISWLRQLKLEQYAEGLTDFANFIESITPTKETMKMVLATLIILVLIIILYYILLEFRHAGLLPWGRKKQDNKLIDISRLSTDLNHPEWQEIVRLPTQKQPAAILKYVLHYLTENDLLNYESANTNLELFKLLKKTSPDLASNFKELLHDVEPVIYGNRETDDLTLQRIHHAASLMTSAGNTFEG